MFHCSGWCFTWAVTAVGGTHVCLRKIDPNLIWELFDTEGITHYNGAPTVQISLVDHPKAHWLDRQVTVTVAGAPPSPTLLGRMRELNLRPVHVYGLTETYGPYTVCEWHQEWDRLPLAEQARLLARQGQNNVVADPVRVVDEAMNDIPRDGMTIAHSTRNVYSTVGHVNLFPARSLFSAWRTTSYRHSFTGHTTKMGQ